MKLEVNDRRRQLTVSDLERGKEFTLAQASSVEKPDGSSFNLRVGDVIKIAKCYESGFEISVNGHFKNARDSLVIPIGDVGDFTIVDEE